MLLPSCHVDCHVVDQFLPSNKWLYQNSFIGEQKCRDAINGKSLENVCKYDGKSTQPIENQLLT